MASTMNASEPRVNADIKMKSTAERERAIGQRFTGHQFSARHLRRRVAQCDCAASLCRA